MFGYVHQGITSLGFAGCQLRVAHYGGDNVAGHEHDT